MSNPQPAPVSDRPSARSRLVRQSVMLSGGFAAAQLCSFLRNALIGYALSKGDFGIAATITLVLQMLETLSDLGADRLLVQATDGDKPAMMAAAHTTLALRGLITACLIYLSAAAVAAFFGIPNARTAFEAASLVPLIKGFMHLDSRREQRSMQNRNFVLIEVIPQVASLAATFPALALIGGYQTVVSVAILQALLSVATSHIVSSRPYRIGFEAACMKRLIAFGWPIWLSAFPLVLVYQGDRIIIGRLLGMDALAGYSAAFMIAMVPGLLAAKVGHALMLPLLSAQQADRAVFEQRYIIMCEAASIAAAIYLAGFVIAGGKVLPLAFGPQYTGLGAVVAWLGAMWSLRMVQAVPGMALMAVGDTRPLLTAGILRAAAIGLVFAAVQMDLGLAGAAAAGVAGEVASLIYVSIRVGQGKRAIVLTPLRCALLPLAAGTAAAGFMTLLPAGPSAWLIVPVTIAAGAVCLLAGLASMPAARGFIEGWIDRDGVKNTPLKEENYVTTRA